MDNVCMLTAITAKVPRSQKAVVARQAGEKVQTAAMVDADGNVVAFNAAGVAKDPAA